jgi:hypothetical protein
MTHKCNDCGSDQAYEFGPYPGREGPEIWLCSKCLQKRANEPGNEERTEAYIEISEFLEKGGKLS